MLYFCIFVFLYFCICNLIFLIEVKQCRVAVTGPECPVCFEELKPPLKVVQCEAGHKVGQHL